MDAVFLIYALSGLLVVTTIIAIVIVRRGQLLALLFDIDVEDDSFTSSSSGRTPPKFSPHQSADHPR